MTDVPPHTLCRDGLNLNGPIILVLYSVCLLFITVLLNSILTFLLPPPSLPFTSLLSFPSSHPHTLTPSQHFNIHTLTLTHTHTPPHTFTHTLSLTHNTHTTHTQAKGMDYRYTDNINFWLHSLHKLGLPKVYITRVT